jgi:hypothetical protein
MVLVAIVDAVIKDFKGTPKAWSRYRYSPAFRYESGDRSAYNCAVHTVASYTAQHLICFHLRLPRGARFHHFYKSIHSFIGSAGHAIISKTATYLLTISCYWSQAERELDNNWVLIHIGMASRLQDWMDWIAMSPQSSTITYGLL